MGDRSQVYPAGGTAEARPVSGADRRMDDYDKPTTELFKEILANVQDLIRSEVQLAKVELREESRTAMKAIGMMAVGGVLALFGLGFLLVMCAALLSLVLPAWVAHLLMAVILFAIGGVMLMYGRQRMRQVHPVPKKTVETIREDLQWSKNPIG